MERYRHTQIGYLMLAIILLLVVLFAWIQITARAEPPSEDSGANFAITAIMVLVLFILGSFSTLTVAVDEQSLKIRFGWGIFRKSFQLKEMAAVKRVKNHWYYGWGIRLWLWPHMWIFNISGFDAVELTMKDGKFTVSAPTNHKSLRRPCLSLYGNKKCTTREYFPDTF